MIELKNVKKIYGLEGAETTALKDISFSINSGEFIAIIGHSGSGKSTLMNIIGFLDTVSHGNYYFKGENITNFNENQLAEIRNKEIGFVFQSFNLLARTTALDNVKMPLIYANVPESQQNERAQKMLIMMGLEHRLHHMPNQLSGGQQQRVAISRALINQPSLILADEPTGNLDSHSGDEVMKIFNRLNKEEGHTIILVTHEKNIAAHAERIITILDGKIISDERKS
ncbi:TPA: macrolide ABC transporter ATP-binding protein [Candidatus Peregrinibacteria bacterium]|nr:macrolide ABC transporter ATP-binding protein [Candidatus Peregrinibacteria bacterium]